MAFSGKALTTANTTLAAVLGSNFQVMTTYTVAHNLLLGLVADQVTPADIAVSVVAATYDTIKQLKNSTAALATKEGLSTLYKSAYTKLAPPAAAPEATRRLLVFATDASQLDSLFAGTAEVGTCYLQLD